MITSRILAERLTLLVAVVALLWAMDWVYVNGLIVAYGTTGYPGYPFVHRGTVFLMACWAIGMLPAFWMPLTVRRPSQVLIWCMYLMVVLPTAVVGVYATQPPTQTIAMLAGMALGLAIIGVSSLLPPLRIPIVHADRALFWTIVIAMSVIAYVATYRTFGTTMRIVTLSEIYYQRAVAVGVGAGQFTAYMLSWQEMAINPLLMALGLAHRRPLMFLAGALGQVFFFAVAAERVLLATPFIVIGFHLFLKRGGARFAVKVTVASFCAFAGAVLVYPLGGLIQSAAQLIFQALLNRLFLNTGFVTTLYFKYFEIHPHVGFAQVKPLSLFLHSPYTMNYTEAMAFDIWGQFSDPNANLFADGFAQLGYTGLVIEAAALAVALWVLDSVTRQRGLSLWLVAMICGAQVSSVVNHSTSNIILGDGLSVIVVLLILLPRSEALEAPLARRTWRQRARAVVPAAAA